VLAQGIFLDSQQGRVGDTITFTIQLDRVVHTIQTLGFDVSYDPQVLQYTGAHAAGELTRGFDFFQASALAPGRVRVGGFTTGQPIAEGSSGRLVTLEFRALQPGHSTLSLTRPVDDIATWPMPTGRFESTAPASPRQPTSTASAPSGPRSGSGIPSPANLPVVSIPVVPVAPGPRTAAQPVEPQQRSIHTPPAVTRPTPDTAARSAMPSARGTAMLQQSSRPASSAQENPSPRAFQGNRTTTYPPPRQLAAAASPPPHRPAGSGTPVYGTGKSTLQTPEASGTDAPGERFFQHCRAVLPVVAIVIVGGIIVALVSMKGAA
jgi:hypothetical protein